MGTSLFADTKKILLSFGVGAACMLIYLNHTRQPCPVSSSPKEHTTKVQQRTIVTEKPDGSKVTEIVKDTTKIKVTPTKPDKLYVSRPRYSLDVRYLPSLTEKPEWSDMDVSLGARLADSPLSATIGYDFKYNQLSLGVRYEW